MKIVNLFLCMICASCSIANEETCLEFSEDVEKNKVKDFLKSFKRDFDKSEVSHFNFYSSSYDLNGDGVNEYFYFFDHYWFCGTMGCDLMAYESKDGKFRPLFEVGIYGLDNFKPGLNKNVCILAAKDNSWRRLKINNQFEMKYVDGFYKFIRVVLDNAN